MFGRKSFKKTLRLWVEPCLRSWATVGCGLMLRRPDPEPSTQRALAWLGSATSHSPVPVATWTHTDKVDI